ncbi:MAG: primosomal protein N' [Anaerolineae bacterium]|nr:primosomal protein N' [Anaerolineae bacterium]
MYAKIAVNRPLRQTFDYHIPPDLTGQIMSGHLVKVGFGTAHTTGIVVALSENTEIPETKPILERLDPEPVVTPSQLALAHWLAEQTLAPIGLCLWLMLPPGLAKRGDMVYTLAGDETDSTADGKTEVKSATQKRIISLLTLRGPMRGRQFSHVMPQTRWQQSIAGLVKRGVIQREPVLDPPDVKPKTIRTVRLAVPPERLRDIAPRLGRESRRANVLEVLLATSAPRMNIKDLATAAGCAESTVKALGKEGDVAVESAQVELLLTPEAARQRIIELRGGQLYLDILILLAQAAAQAVDEVPVKDVYAQTEADAARLQQLADEGLIVLGEAETWRDPLAERDFVPTLAPPLTAEQALVWEEIRQYIDMLHWGDITPSPEQSGVFLLHGVTGSGKTEIYLRAVERVLAQGRQAIVLVPEISLTPQTVRRFAARFPGRVSIVHSSLSVGERYDTWRRARMGDIHIIVGARSALFAPLPDVGLVILDEEHDDSYKQSPPIVPPYYHARDTAIEMMRITRGTVILGSATPDVVTYFHAEQGRYHLLQLPDRVLAHRERIAEQVRRLNATDARYQPIDASDAVSAELPTVHVVDMREELRDGNRSIFSRALRTAINEVLARNEQAILFLNRRGTATFVMCRDCGYIAMCPRCNTPLTYHSPRQALSCHYCGYQTGHLSVCPDCQSKRIKHFGQGTELIESAVKEEFPQARTIRWDRDTATGRDAHEIILKQFSEGHANILIGTQMIAKGLDLPQVTLVGIMSADTALGLPDYRAGERSFQLLTQVAGRAGRGILGGRVVLQSYLPDHYAIRAAAHHDYETFYRQELAYRREQRYPPFERLARILFQYPTPTQAESEAQRAATLLRDRIETGHYTATEIIGPTPCFFGKLNNLYRWHLILRGPNPAAILSEITPGTGWFVDVAPVDML